MTYLESDINIVSNRTEEISLYQFPVRISEKGILSSPEFRKHVVIDSIVLDWVSTVDSHTVGGKRIVIPHASFSPTIPIARVIGIERKAGDRTQDRLLEILSVENPRILLIHAHGAVINREWVLSVEGFGRRLINMKDFLLGPIKDQVGKTLYNLIVIDACSNDSNGVGNYTIPQAITNELNIPIFYVRGASSMLMSSERVLAEPLNRS